ncbi:MAG: hypothetical protein IJM30_05665 [Thermoguttaceae bacterium]|nr:hypothetical protein [Thermoguttaceae bacterium]
MSISQFKLRTRGVVRFLIASTLFFAALSASSSAVAQTKLSQDFKFTFSSIFNDQNDNTPQAPVVTGIAVKGSDMYVGADDRFVYRFDMNAGIPERVFQRADSWVRAVAYSPTANEIASLSQNGQLATWNPQTGQKLRQASDKITGSRSFAYSPSGNVIAVTSFDPVVSIFDASSLTKLRSWTAPQGGVTTIAFSHYGNLLAAGGRGGIVRIWNTESERVERDLTFMGQDSGAPRRVRAIAFSKDDSLIAVGGDDDRIFVWETTSGRLVAQLQLPVSESSRKQGKGKVFSLTFCEGSVLASGDSLNRVILWNVASKTILGDPEKPAHTGTVSTLLYVPKEAGTPNGPYLFSGGFDTTVIRWKLE